jgi:competence protein ComEC
MNPHRASLSRHPLAEIAVAFAAGVCAANYFSIRLSVLAVAGGVCAVVVLIALLKERFSFASVALFAAIGLAGAAVTTQETGARNDSELGEFVGQEVVVTGVLARPPEFGRDRLYLTLRVERLDVGGIGRSGSGVIALLAQFRGAADEREFRSVGLQYGARIRVVTTLSRTDNYRNPGVSPLTEYLDRKGYDANGVVKSSASIQRMGDVWVFPPVAWLYRWRASLQEEIHARFDAETAGVLDASLLGNRYHLSRETAEKFREGGSFHVLVISGLHISFIGGVVFLAMKRLTKRRVLQFVLPAVVVWSYSLAVGAEASVVRAALMFTFAGLAPVLFRHSSSLNGLGAAALVLLVDSPKELFDPSFQLTFLSVLAIVVVAWPLLQTCRAIGAWYPTRETPAPPVCSRGLRWFCEVLFWSERKWQKEIARSPYRYRLFKPRCAALLERYRVQVCLRYVFAAVIVSGGVQLLLLPLMIIYFHRLSVASLVLNIIVSVLLTVLTAVALAGLLVSQLSVALAAPFFKLANTIDWLMIHSVDPFAHYNAASVRLPEYSGWAALVYVLYYAPLLVLVVFRPKRQVALLVIVQVLLVAVLIAHPFSALADGRLRIDFLDVGQGDAVVVTLPDGRVLLVDAGGTTHQSQTKTDRRSIGEAVVSEYLWWRGFDTVNYVLPTHADADHIDGLNDVLRNFSVDAALVARSPANDPEYAKFAQTIAATNTPVAAIQAGDLIRFGGVEIEVLWPPRASDPSEPSRNNDSTVLRVRFGRHSLLLTGDIEKSGERALVSTNKDLTAQVVKVPHHGSRSSSTLPFVNATKAKVAVISVGKNSMFGHPHRDVVERWQANGAQVLTTGACGAITVTTDGTDLTVTGMQSHTSRGSLCRAGP